jgi:hypothetical protein
MRLIRKVGGLGDEGPQENPGEGGWWSLHMDRYFDVADEQSAFID